MSQGSVVSEAIEIYLRNYPGNNDVEFDSHFGTTRAALMKDQVHQILREAMKVEPDWTRMSLNEAGDFVEGEMLKRHPELSTEALRAIGNYYTYLMR